MKILLQNFICVEALGRITNWSRRVPLLSVCVVLKIHSPDVLYICPSSDHMGIPAFSALIIG